MAEANSSILNSIWEKLSNDDKATLLAHAVAGQTATSKSISTRPQLESPSPKKTKTKHLSAAVQSAACITPVRKLSKTFTKFNPYSQEIIDLDSDNEPEYHPPSAQRETLPAVKDEYDMETIDAWLKKDDSSESDLDDVFLAQNRLSKSTSNLNQTTKQNPDSKTMAYTKIALVSTTVPSNESSLNLNEDYDLVSVASNESQVSSNSENDFDPDNDEVPISKEAKYPPFSSKLHPPYVEFSSIFPAFPNTHEDGYAYVMEIPSKFLNTESIHDFKSACQYTLTLGHGARTRNHSEFFAVDGVHTPMEYSMRQCAGVKACEFLADEHKIPHTSVDEKKGHRWAFLLAEQEKDVVADPTRTQELEFFNLHGNSTCDRFTPSTGKPCGGQTCIRARAQSGRAWERLFIGCSNYKAGELHHHYIPLRGHNPTTVLRVWKKDRCWIPSEILEELRFSWDDDDDFTGTRSETSIRPTCHQVYANRQGSKDKKCPFYHVVGTQHRKGNLISYPCKVKFYYFYPTFDKEGTPSTNLMAVICKGEHNHPPPPPIKIPEDEKNQWRAIFNSLGIGEITSRKLLTSSSLPILLNGETTLSSHHLSLNNLGAINHLIRKEKLKQHPFGTSLLGVQHLMHSRVANPYIRVATQFSNGKFMILCQFRAQSEMFFTANEIHADKTFKRSKYYREFEINSYDPVTQRLTTLSRIWMEEEDTDSYYHAFRLAFETAEADVGRRIPWAHLLEANPRQSSRSSRFGIKAILLDEHGGQYCGLAKYFDNEYSQHGDADWHTSRLVKICTVHYQRSIEKLEGKGVSTECCRALNELLSMSTKQAFDGLMNRIREMALVDPGKEELTNWLEHKDRNPWVLQGLCFPLTNMSSANWYSTRFDTNLAESAHAFSQRYGTQLSLVGAVMASERIDEQFFKMQQVVESWGVGTKYGNDSVSGRAQKNFKRQAKAREKKAKGKTGEKAMDLAVNEATERLVDALATSQRFQMLTSNEFHR